MLSSMLSSSTFMVGTETIIGTLILIAFLLINEFIRKEDGRKYFTPVLFTLAAVFFSIVGIAVHEVLK